MKLFEIKAKYPFYGKVLNLFIIAEDEEMAFLLMEKKLFHRTTTEEYFDYEKYSLLVDRENVIIEEVNLNTTKVLFQETSEPN